MPAIITTNMPPINPGPAPIMVDTIKAFRVVLDNAVLGQKIIYYTGDLMFDRDAETTRLGARAKHDLNRLADAVYDAAQVDRVHLLQRRLGKNKWEYFAVVRR